MALLKAHVPQTYISANPMENVLNVSTTRSVQDLAINVQTEFVSVETYPDLVTQLAAIFVMQMTAMACVCVVKISNVIQKLKHWKPVKMVKTIVMSSNALGIPKRLPAN